MKKLAAWGFIANLLLIPTAFADPADPQDDLVRSDQIEELEEKIEILAEDLERMRSEAALPTEEPELESVHGHGPAASKIFHVAQGLSIGGYGEGFYQNLVGDKGASKDRWPRFLARGR